jgi:hypothetical protein
MRLHHFPVPIRLFFENIGSPPGIRCVRFSSIVFELHYIAFIDVRDAAPALDMAILSFVCCHGEIVHTRNENLLLINCAEMLTGF